MNNLPNKDIKLTNFLKQNRSIAPPPSPELEDRLMVQIALLPPEKTGRFLCSWQRYLMGGIGITTAGFIGATIFQVVNPPELSIAELNQLNLYLEAHVPDLLNQSETGTENHENLVDLDIDLF